jgi:hypothetical protein
LKVGALTTKLAVFTLHSRRPGDKPLRGTILIGSAFRPSFIAGRTKKQDEAL